MGGHCSRPHDGSDPGGVGCLRLRQDPWGLTGWIVRNGIGVAPRWVELHRNVSAEQGRADMRKQFGIVGSWAAQHCSRRNQKCGKEVLKNKTSTMMNGGVICPTVCLLDTGR
jgi:hypothetical protein